MTGVGKDGKRAKPGNNRKGVHEFFILCLEVKRVKFKGKSSFSAHILYTRTHTLTHSISYVILFLPPISCRIAKEEGDILKDI